MLEFLQSEASECGLACLAYIASSLGNPMSLRKLRSRFPTSSRGSTLADLKEIAVRLEMEARPLRCELDEISQLQTPALLHWRLNHFVVLLKAKGKKLYIFDPAAGSKTISLAEADANFTGIATEFRLAAGFVKRRQKERLKLSSLVMISRDSRSSILKVIFFAIAVLIYSSTSPLVLKYIIDSVVPISDLDLLSIVAFGAALLAVFGAFSGYCQGVVSARLSASLSVDMTSRLFRHMLKLPLVWFQKRRTADIVSRFDAIDAIRGTVAGLAASAVTDTLTLLIVGVLLTALSPTLFLVVLGLMGIDVCIKAASLQPILKLSGAALASSISEHVVRIESVRAIQTIKAMSGERQQQEYWGGKLISSIGATNKRDCALVGVRSFELGIRSAGDLVVIYLMARMVISNDLALGTMFAVVAYKGQLLSATESLLDQFIRWRTGEVYSHRLADVVLTETEKGLDVVGSISEEITGSIRVENLAFRYGENLPHVFKGITLDIPSGDYVAITGPSGCGKSTLLAAICGLYEAEFGLVLLDGRPLDHWGKGNVRRLFGVVLQNDSLLSGTIAQNVSFFAEETDLHRVWECLEMAAVRDDVEAMPMGLDTFVGDMGLALSGGQRQRVLVARALYRRPKILLFDEASSHLDVLNETKMNANIAALNITRIVVAHRPETIKSANRVFDMANGRFLSKDEISTVGVRS